MHARNLHDILNALDAARASFDAAADEETASGSGYSRDIALLVRDADAMSALGRKIAARYSRSCSSPDCITCRV